MDERTQGWIISRIPDSEGQVRTSAVNIFTGRRITVTDPSYEVAVGQIRHIVNTDESVGGMTDHALRVAQFAIRGGQDVPRKPTMPDESTRRLRCLLLLEETLEFIEASGFALDQYTTYHEEEGLHCKIGLRFGYTLVKTRAEPDYGDMIDACADISVVNTGTLIALGAGDEDVLQTVDEANLAKVSGTVRRDPITGKVLKPDGWKPPVYSCVAQYEQEAHEGI